MTHLEQIKEDVLKHIRTEGITVTPENRDELYDRLCDDLWDDDGVTGNGSGSYTLCRDTAMEYVLADGEEYLADLIKEYGLSADEIAKHFLDWEYWDVLIRCYLLGQAVSDALDDCL